MQTALESLARRDARSIRSYTLLDASGNLVWDTRAVGLALGPASNQSGEDYFRIPYKEWQTLPGARCASRRWAASACSTSARRCAPSAEGVLGVLMVEFRASVPEDLLRRNREADGLQSYPICWMSTTSSWQTPSTRSATDVRWWFSAGANRIPRTAKTPAPPDTEAERIALMA